MYWKKFEDFVLEAEKEGVSLDDTVTIRTTKKLKTLTVTFEEFKDIVTYGRP